MQQINCYIPITLRITGRPSDAQLDELSETLVRALTARIAFAEQTILSCNTIGSASRFEGGTVEFAREAYDPSREGMVANRYNVPAYDDQGASQSVPVTRPHDIDLPGLQVQTFAELWRQFNTLRPSAWQTLVGLVEAAEAAREALALVPRLLATMSTEDALEHAGDLAFWLTDQGQWPLAQQALERLETAWWLRYISETGPGVPIGPGVFGPAGPRQLIDRAKAEASADRNDQAFRLFGLAFLFLQMQLQQFYERRTATLEELEALGEGGTTIAAMTRVFSYQNLEQMFGMMREILSFYPRLEREALLAGDQALANRYSTLGFALRLELEENYTLEEGRAITMESIRTAATEGGPRYVIYGAHGREEIVTPLPGTPPPEEIGQYPVYYQTMEELVEAIAGQEEFVTDLYHHPEIVAEFGSSPPDMANLDDRLRVWRTMYRIYQRERLYPLGSLLDLMEEYLRRFTRHTVYNVRDLAGPSYLVREMPEDLVGRTVRDCGVYALTVAYEVYRAARSAQPCLPLDFELFTMPEHVTLVIFDRSEDAHYVVNNDRIDGPFREDVLDSVARLYGLTMGRRFFVSPAIRYQLGSTAQGVSAFRTQAWQRYRTAVSWYLRPQPPAESEDGPTEAERLQAAYERYYEQMELFSAGAATLHTRLDSLTEALQPLAPSARRQLLDERLPDLVTIGRGLAEIFITYGQQAAINAPSALAGQQAQYVFYAHTGGQVCNPIARLGMALLHYQAVGGTLDEDAQELVAWMRTVTQFGDDLNRYQSAGRPAAF